MPWLCAQCGKKTVGTTRDALISWKCESCDLVWIAGDSLAAVLPRAGQFRDLINGAAVAGRSPRALTCPQCHTSSFRTLRASGHELDVCSHCGGIILDPGELSAVESLRSSRVAPAVEASWSLTEVLCYLEIFF